MAERVKDDLALATKSVAVSVTHGFGQFYKCPKFSDVALLDAVGNKIAAHRLVLSAGSRKFNEMLSHSQEPACELCIVDIEADCLHAMLEYLYTNQCNIQMHNAVELLSAAMLYGCDELESMASLYIHMQLNAGTCCFFFSEAQKHKVEHIAIKALYVASIDFQNVICSQSFMELSLENLTALLGSPKLGGISKETLQEAGWMWMGKDQKRIEKYQDIMICIETRPSSQSDEFCCYMNSTEGTNTNSGGTGNMDWESAAATMTTVASENPFRSKHSVNEVSQRTTMHNTRCPVSLDVWSAQHLLKDMKSDERGTRDEAARLTTAINVAFFADRLKKSEQRSKPLDAGESVKPLHSVEENGSSEVNSTRRAKINRGRGHKGPGKVGQAYMCQVEGCTNSLQGLKDYHIRYKICNHHLKVSSIVKDDKEQRFCQQCGRFHPLEEFDNNKRSCRARLLRHNERRRKRLNGHSKSPKQNSLLSMPSVEYPSHPRLVYFPTPRDLDAHSTNVEKLCAGGRSGCLQFLGSSSEANSCLVFSPVPRSSECDPNSNGHEKRTHTIAAENEVNSTSRRMSFVKPDPANGKVAEKSAV